jgi:hypothetical protein
MRLRNVPLGTTDWSAIPPTVHRGVTGTATVRARQLGDIQLRVVDYGAGYMADHWCPKGHILYVLSGALVLEHDDGSQYSLAPGMSWHVGDDEGPPHRVTCESGARVFIVD